jgi:hypothetical protein
MCLSVDPPEVYDVAVGTGHRKPNCSLGGVSQAERGKRGPEPEGLAARAQRDPPLLLVACGSE